MPPRTKRRKRAKIPKATRDYVHRAIDAAIPDKNHDEYTSSTEMYSTWDSQCWTGIVQGMGDGTRIGDIVTVKELQCRAFVKPGTTASATAPVACRFMIVQFKADYTTGATGAALSEIALRNTTTTPQSLVSPYHVDNKSLYKVVKDMRFIISPADIGRAINIRIPGKRFVRVRYDTGSTDATGHIYVIWASDSATGTNAPLISMQCHLLYEDQ